MDALTAMHAADLADECGISVDAALDRFIAAGGLAGDPAATIWLTIAFIFGRQLRDSRPVTLAGR